MRKPVNFASVLMIAAALSLWVMRPALPADLLSGALAPVAWATMR